MAIEGMVDALRHAHRMVRPTGCVLDLHPSVIPASVEVGGLSVGRLESGEAAFRHASADRALSVAVQEQMFTIDREATFSFSTWGDTIEELRDYVDETFKDSHITDQTLQRARMALIATPGVRPRLVEKIRITLLRPVCAR